MLLVHPLIPVYAADESVAPESLAPLVESTPAEVAPEAAPAESVSTELPATDTPPPETPAVEEGANTGTGETPADESASDSTPPASADTRADGTDTSTPGEGSQTPAEDGAGSTDTPPADTASSSDSSSDPTDSTETPGDTTGLSDTTDASTTPAIEGTENTEATASTTDALAPTSEETASSSEETLTEGELAPEETPAEVAPEETPEQIVTRLLIEREAVLRNQLRKEVETEFTKGCVTMDRVGYYCLKEGTNGALTPSQSVTAVSIGAGSTVGYQQVLVTRGGVTSELTSDPWDSAFPATDLSGHSVVWQGNISDRWQIFFAEVSASGTPVILQVTHAAESNFNPRVEGGTIVWQGWVDGNWEIYRATRLSPEAYPALDLPLSLEHTRLGVDRTWDLERITENDTHDMFPAIAGGLITWQSFRDGTWSVFAYSTQMKTTTQLSHNGRKSENPRFSVTWDERGEDGQMRMMGYDIATGKVVDITSEARQVPDNTPYSTPEAPISQPDQAALPSTASSTSTSSRTDDGDDTPDNGLDV